MLDNQLQPTTNSVVLLAQFAQTVLGHLREGYGGRVFGRGVRLEQVPRLQQSAWAR